MDSSDKKELPVLIPITKKSDFRAKNIDIDIIGADVYCAAYYLKRAQVFAISKRDIQYQVEKETRAETNPTSIVPQEYHDFLHIFSKKNAYTLLPYQKYDHKIYLEEEQKPGHATLYKISPKELDAVERYFDSHPAKEFI